MMLTMDEHIAGVDWLENHGVVLFEHGVEDVSAMVEQVIAELAIH
jgi:hypothetical protein